MQELLIIYKSKPYLGEYYPFHLCPQLTFFNKNKIMHAKERFKEKLFDAAKENNKPIATVILKNLSAVQFPIQPEEIKNETLKLFYLQNIDFFTKTNFPENVIISFMVKKKTVVFEMGSHRSFFDGGKQYFISGCLINIDIVHNYLDIKNFFNTAKNLIIDTELHHKFVADRLRFLPESFIQKIDEILNA